MRVAIAGHAWCFAWTAVSRCKHEGVERVLQLSTLHHTYGVARTEVARGRRETHALSGHKHTCGSEQRPARSSGCKSGLVQRKLNQVGWSGLDWSAPQAFFVCFAFCCVRSYSNLNISASVRRNKKGFSARWVPESHMGIARIQQPADETGAWYCDPVQCVHLRGVQRARLWTNGGGSFLPQQSVFTFSWRARRFSLVV